MISPRTKYTKPPKNPKGATLENLLGMHKNSKIDLKKLEIINQAIRTHLESLYVWGSEPLDNVEGRKVKVPMKRLQCTLAM